MVVKDQIVILRKIHDLCLYLSVTALQTNVKSRKWVDCDVFGCHNNSCVTSAFSKQNLMKYYCQERSQLLTWKSSTSRSPCINLSLKNLLPFAKFWQPANISLFQFFCHIHIHLVQTKLHYFMESIRLQFVPCLCPLRWLKPVSMFDRRTAILTFVPRFSVLDAANIKDGKSN